MSTGEVSRKNFPNIFCYHCSHKNHNHFISTLKKRTLLIILGNLTAFGPFVTDFYLPCLPELTSYFAQPEAIIQTSLTASMLGLAAVQGAAPIVAPVLGGAAFSLSCWQGAFILLGIWGICLWMSCRPLEETLPAAKRLHMPIWESFRCYFTVLGHPIFAVMTLLLGFSTAALMAYISASPFLFQNHFGLTPMQYSLCFAFNAVGLTTDSAAIVKMRGMVRATTLSVNGLLLTSLTVALSLWLEGSFLLFEAGIFLMLFCVGLLTPVAMTRALNAVSGNKGVASALLGATPFLLGGIVAPLTGLGNLIVSTAGVILSCTLVCFILWLLLPLTNRRPQASAVHAERSRIDRVLKFP